MFKGIYMNELTKNVYFVNSQTETSVNVSTVLVNSIGGMYRVLDCTKEIPVRIFKKFYHSGNYTKESIND